MKKIIAIITLFFAIAVGATAQISASDAAKYRAMIPQLKQKASAGDKEAMETIVDLFMCELSGYMTGDAAAKSVAVSKSIPESKIVEYAQICVEESKSCQSFLEMWPTLKIMVQQAKTLIAKYGLKAYNSISKAKVYGGMPAGIITEYKTVEQDGSRYQYYNYVGTFRDKIGSYKKYVPTDMLALANSLGSVCPRVIKARNGKVTNIIW